MYSPRQQRDIEKARRFQTMMLCIALVVIMVFILTHL